MPVEGASGPSPLAPAHTNDAPGPSRFDSLETLLGGMSRQAFFADYLGRNWLHVKAGKTQSLDLVALADLELLLFDGDRRDKLFHAVGGPGASPDDDDTANHYCSADEAMDEWAAGRTLIFNGIDRQLPRIATLTRGLEGELKCRVWSNLYLTPAGGHGFRTHYDSHDVFVVQLIGSKRWRIGEQAADAPMPFQGHDQMPEMGPQYRELVLQAGEVLYVPRGVLHDAVAQEDLSCHLTIGIHPKTYLDAILTAVTVAADRDPRFRQHLPLGVFSLDDGVITQARSLLASISDKDFADVGEAFCELLGSQRRRSPQGLLGLMGKSGGLSELDRFRAKKYLMASLFFEDHMAVLHGMGKAMTFPLDQAVDLRICCSGQAFGLSDLKAQASREAASAFVRRLLLEGVLDRLNSDDAGEIVPVDFIAQQPAPRGAGA